MSEPVAWRVHPFDYGIGSEGVHAITQIPQQRDAWIRKGRAVEPLYKAPPDHREVMRMALEALKYHVEQTRPIERTSVAIQALREALGGLDE